MVVLPLAMVSSRRGSIRAGTRATDRPSSAVPGARCSDLRPEAQVPSLPSRSRRRRTRRVRPRRTDSQRKRRPVVFSCSRSLLSLGFLDSDSTSSAEQVLGCEIGRRKEQYIIKRTICIYGARSSPRTPQRYMNAMLCWSEGPCVCLFNAGVVVVWSYSPFCPSWRRYSRAFCRLHLLHAAPGGWNRSRGCI